MKGYNEEYEWYKETWATKFKIPEKLADQFIWLLNMCEQTICPENSGYACKNCMYGRQLNKLENVT